MPKQKYNPVLGQHIADFTEWYRSAAQNQSAIDALQQYGSEHQLPRNALYEIARYLEEHDWAIDANVLSPDYEGEEEITGLEQGSVFDRYFRAIKEKRYEDAHDIYESMAPSEQQVIKDRRATVFNKLYKIAQKARQEGWHDIVTKIATLWDEQPQMLVESYRALLAELAEVNAKIKEAEGKKTIEDDDLVEYAKHLEQTKMEMETLMKEKDLEHPLVGDAAKLIAPEAGLEKFKAALSAKNYEEARNIFMELSPEEQAQATEFAKVVFAVADELINLHKLGSDLFAQGKYVEAAEISEVIEACMPEMVPEGQQIVLLVLDPGMAKNLPQAFEAQEEQGPPVTEVLDNLRGRALPECPGCGGVPATFNKVVELANLLDDRGHTVEADKLDAWLVKVADEVKKQKANPVKQTKCEVCGTEMYYTEGTPRPRYCRRCLSAPWPAHKTERASIEAAKKEEDKKDSPKTTKCESCGVEMWYKEPKDKPRWCPHCLKGPWAAHKTRGSLDLEAAKKKKSKKVKMKEGKPAKVIEIADAIRRDSPGTSDEAAYRMAWETYCSYTNPGYKGCGPKGKSKRKSPKPYSKAAVGAGAVSTSVPLYVGEKYQGDLSLDRAIELETRGVIDLEQTESGWVAHKKVQPEKK